MNDVIPTNSNYCFVQLSHNYGDEFDIDSCFVMTADELRFALEKIEQNFNAGKYEDREFYFGTNEYLQFKDYVKFIEGVQVATCSQVFYEEFERLEASTGYNVLEKLLEVA